MPKIVIDLRMVEGRLHGIGRYALELMQRVPRLRPSWQFVGLIAPRGRASFPAFAPNVKLRRMHARFLSPLEQPDLLFALLRERPSIFHATSFSLPALWPGKLVATLHDATHLAFPQYFGWSRAFYYQGLVKPRVRFATELITVSRFSQADLATRLGISSERFEVIPLGVSDEFQTADRLAIDDFLRRRGIPPGYFAAIGNVKKHKNLAVLAPVAKTLPAPLVIITGGRIANKLGFPDSTLELKDLPEQELPLFFSGAHALLLPSLYEGFGLPMIEAMACGCPVIASNASALPEIGGQAALYASPNSADEWREAALTVLSDTGVRRRLVERGLERARSFSWDKCASQTLAVYERALPTPNKPVA